MAWMGPSTTAASRVPGSPWRRTRPRSGSNGGTRSPASPTGDEFQASVWVRTRDANGGTGAYFALEYLDADGKRCGISHSTVNLDNGGKGWQRLTVEGVAATGAKRLRVNLIFNAHGTAWFDDVEVVRTGRFVPWPDLGNSQRTVTIDTKQVVQPNFAGVGYHVFHHVHPISQDHWEQVVGKRWRELNPSFARMNHSWDWSPEQVETAARHMAFFQTTGTQLYLATWNPKDTTTDAERKAYAKLIVDELEYLVRQKGLTNIRFYCMTNELSLVTWGKLARDLPKFRDYHQALYDEIQARKLDIKLLATDASPISFWDTIQWATQNMDEITGIYGGHHYVNDRTLDDERFYPWFLAKMQWGVGLARAKHKDFVLGEFGSKQDGRTINGVFQDRCVYFDTPQESVMPIQVSEAALAAINAGSYALGYWTFMDFPDQPGAKRINKWGLFKWSGHDYSTRPIYYAYGLLSKFFRGPSTVYRIEGNDPRLRVAAVEHHDRKTWSIAAVNRNQRDIRVVIRLDGAPVTARFRKYVYDPSQPPANPFGDLQEPVGKVEMSQGRLTDTISAGTLAVYTTAYDDDPPAAVKGLTVAKTETGKPRLEWQPNLEPDLCYYRIYRSPGPTVPISIKTQIASTIATSFNDTQAESGVAYTYKIVAVDQSGNAGESESFFPPLLLCGRGCEEDRALRPGWGHRLGVPGGDGAGRLATARRQRPVLLQPELRSPPTGQPERRHGGHPGPETRLPFLHHRPGLVVPAPARTATRWWGPPARASCWWSIPRVPSSGKSRSSTPPGTVACVTPGRWPAAITSSPRNPPMPPGNTARRASWCGKSR